MKLRTGYMLRQISGIFYILPVGQNIADHKRGIRLNESGALLWHALQNDVSKEELVTLLATHYGEDEQERSIFAADVTAFLTQLSHYGMLADYGNATDFSASYEQFFRIGTLTLCYQGPKELFYPSFEDFTCKASVPDQTLRIHLHAPKNHANGEILIRTPEITICRNETDYLFLYPAGYSIYECVLSKDGSHADFYCSNTPNDTLAEKLFHAIRFVFLVKAQLCGLFALHSASILYKDKAWLFAAPSGTGKSTHTAIWNRLFKTPHLNGDLNLIGICDGKPVVYGIPWCGTSNIYTTKTYPLGGITLLKRGTLNRELPLTGDEQTLKVMQRMVSPSWTDEMVTRNLDFAMQLQPKISVFCLQCTKEDAAAQVMKDIIDSSFIEQKCAAHTLAF